MRKEIERQIVAMEGLKGENCRVCRVRHVASADGGDPEYPFREGLRRVEESTRVIHEHPVFLTCCMGDEAFDEAFRGGLEEAKVSLLSLMEKIRRTGLTDFRERTPRVCPGGRHGRDQPRPPRARRR